MFLSNVIESIRSLGSLISSNDDNYSNSEAMTKNMDTYLTPPTNAKKIAAETPKQYTLLLVLQVIIDDDNQSSCILRQQSPIKSCNILSTVKWIF